jgi:predicted DNA-binding protein
MPNADTRKNFGVRLPSSLIAAIEARATTTGRSKTQVVEAALEAYLGMEATPTGQDVEQRLTEIEQRLANVEQRLTENAQHRPTPPDAPEPPTAVSSALLPAPGEGLTTTEAWQYCQQRGYRGSKDAFRSWAKRNPAELRQQFSLEPTGYAGKSNTAPSYRRVE